MVGFRMPTTAVTRSEYVFLFETSTWHDSPKSDVIIQGIDKVPGRLHGVDITD